MIGERSVHEIDRRGAEKEPFNAHRERHGRLQKGAQKTSRQGGKIHNLTVVFLSVSAALEIFSLLTRRCPAIYHIVFLSKLSNLHYYHYIVFAMYRKKRKNWESLKKDSTDTL